ncbi:hypothetical protein AA313_de0207141 [Arthrobotrys entomopaga]|nr:hypothetical protein AA313_de0207141 [Arthrobotrys entomopaga]
MLTFRFSLWAAALFAFATLCAARTVITTQRCTTQYCGRPTANVHRETWTVHKSTPYTVTRWKTANKPKFTTTATGTKTYTVTPYLTIRTVTSLHTKWIGTSTHTRQFTVTKPAFTETSPVTIKVVTPPVHTISAPAGFVGVNDDPDNQKAGVNVGPVFRRRERRAAAPEPVPAANRYVTAVTCTKTYITKTGTSDLWKTTTKTGGTSTKIVAWSTITRTAARVTVTAKNAKTINTTTSLNKVAFASSTRTVTAGTTTVYETTITSTLPVPTNYLACGDRNTSPSQAIRQNFAIAITHEGGPGDTTTVKVIPGNGEAYQCCVMCHAYAGPELCVGSIWYHTGLWGDPGCDWFQSDCEPPEPEFNMECHLFLTPNKPGICPHVKFSFISDIAAQPVVVSNGPHCARWKYQKE